VEDVIGGPDGAAIDNRQDTYTGGVFAGYDYRASDKVVIGAEAGFNLSGDDELRSSTADGFVEVDPRHSFDLTARAGYLVTPRTLVYARGGYENVRARLRVEDDGQVALRDSDNLDGWLAGGGVEHALADNVSARLEYRYSDLGSNGADFSRHQVLAGVAYRF
jgi:outer membrane immunogenic protein